MHTEVNKFRTALDNLAQIAISESPEFRSDVFSGLAGMLLPDSFIRTHFNEFEIHEIFKVNTVPEDIAIENVSKIVDWILVEWSAEADYPVSDLLTHIEEKQYSSDFMKLLVDTIFEQLNENREDDEPLASKFDQHQLTTYTVIVANDLDREFILKHVELGNIDILVIGSLSEQITFEDLVDGTEDIPLNEILSYVTEAVLDNGHEYSETISEANREKLLTYLQYHLINR